MYRLDITDFRVWVSMGVTEQERHHAQPILVSVSLVFKEEPEACSSDEISDGVCYAALVSLIEKTLTSNPCALMERLAKVLLEKLEETLAGQVSRIDLRVSKERPPIPDLLGPVSFSIGREVL
ncbi:dihydroneopterin aldolase [Chlamydia suis]|uniref:7,8-dihydroneopterin aldolase n=2 Tax=Chlamydia suis TaxID=83559 RepID=A0AAQ0ERI6_9CHLA|nr:dihydroneopterin aldolase [Chlamydia suis]MEB2681434.1 dihydroneopterin aldolase [Chlamydia suis]MEB2681696.1 dihydroneopterin aldolase [Chlamydia suis]MEB2682617.1 dihydroneopterin aldolase [Chlamydia suis]MEB2684141.1 dihydroneopterin aldolase [Chlamydia suis]MEB2684432.1 dihydroneopterin aldolase [Chlamydia suis]